MKKLSTNWALNNQSNVKIFKTNVITSLSILLSLLSILLLDKIYFAIIIIILGLLFIRYGKLYLISLVLISFMVLSGDLGENLRTVINIADSVILFYLFIKKYGLSVSKFPAIPKLLIYLILFALISMTLSSVFSSDFKEAFYQTIRQSFFFFLWYLIYAQFTDNKKVYSIPLIIIIATSILGVTIFSSYISAGIFSLDTGTYINRFGGIIFNLNAAGELFCVGFPLLIVLPYFYKIDTKRKKLFFGFLIAFIFFSLLLTGSRSSIGSVLISVLFILYKLDIRIFKRVLYGIGLVIVVFILVPELNNLISLYFRVERLTANREIYWGLAYNIFINNFLLGVGPGLFQQSAYKFLPFMLGSWNEFQVRSLFSIQAGLGYAHNFYLFLSSELGILGLILAILLFVIFFYYCYKTIKLARKTNYKYFALSIAITSIGLGLFARSFYESTGLLTYGWIARDLPFWLVFLTLISVYRKINTYTRADNRAYIDRSKI